MNWKKERDLLISQTMTFVQSVTGKKPDFEQASDARSDIAKPNVQAAPVTPAAPVDAIKIGATEIVAPPEDIQANTDIPRAAFSIDVRTEMQARVANFRAHQERFNREREEYFSSTLTKARAGIRNETAPDPSDRVPPNR
jgi:hypothetical protein